mmetsp:Transcript_140941/g.245634  ORF Transcript_140941/g.245634 Transcript_140941/m.245634 type:complete len:92 (-) Transcript_140941:472-747(-)
MAGPCSVQCHLRPLMPCSLTPALLLELGRNSFLPFATQSMCRHCFTLKSLLPTSCPPKSPAQGIVAGSLCSSSAGHGQLVVIDYLEYPEYP